MKNEKIKTKKILSRITAWVLTLAMMIALVPAAFADIDEYSNSVFREIRFTNTESDLSFTAMGNVIAVSSSSQGIAMTGQGEIGFVITRDNMNAYSVEYDDSMVSYGI